MLSLCSVLLCCMCATAALTLATGCPKLEFRGAEDARACPLGRTLAATGATCSGTNIGIICLLNTFQAALQDNAGRKHRHSMMPESVCGVHMLLRSLALGTQLAPIRLRVSLHALNANDFEGCSSVILQPA